MASKGFYIMKSSSKAVNKKRNRKCLQSLYEKHVKTNAAYETMQKEWHKISDKLQKLNQSTCNDDIVAYVQSCYSTMQLDRNEHIIPCATLLTGVNQPDHSEQFSTLKEKIRSDVTPNVATVYAADASSHKAIVEHVVHEFVVGNTLKKLDYDSADIDTEQNNYSVKLNKNRCTMSVLSCWYNEKYNITNVPEYHSPTKKSKQIAKGNQLVIIFPDFEGFNPDILQDFILSLSFHTRVLPFVLVFGVATSASALHKMFPYKVSSKLLIQVFSSQSSTTRINQVLEDVFLTHQTPFHLSGKAFQLLTDIFLFYDFSVTALVQGYKICMMEHYFGRNIVSLCCPSDDISSAVSKLSDRDIEDLRQLHSFREYVEADTCENRIALLTDDSYLKKRLLEALGEIHSYLFSFHAILRVLLILVRDLPKQPLGKQLRELYLTSTSSPITKSEEYKECIKMLHFQSKDELSEKLKKICHFLEGEIKNYTPSIGTPSETESPRKRSSPRKKLALDQNAKVNPISSTVYILNSFSDRIINSSLDLITADGNENVENEPQVKNRHNLKEKLLGSIKKDKKATSEFEFLKVDLMKYLNDYVFEPFLKMPNKLPFYEIFFFTDISKIRRQIIGTPWAAIHTALNNPVIYLQCQCCHLPRPDSIIPSLPDLSIVYKLHLECGKLINLYDWLQAFVCIVDPDKEDEDEGEKRVIKSEYHARFTKAVLELQLLGFVKPSKRKTDHMMRLTW